MRGLETHQHRLGRKALPNGLSDRSGASDADFLGVWYSGWYNGLAKKHAINVPRVKQQIHNVIVHCKANTGKTIIQAIDFVLKQERGQK